MSVRTGTRKVGQPAQKFTAAVVDNGLADDRPSVRHTLPEPRRYAAAMQGKVSDAGPFRHRPFSD
jgi:hypothetical protein